MCPQVIQVPAQPDDEPTDLAPVEVASPGAALQTEPGGRPRKAGPAPRRLSAPVEKSSSAAMWWVLGGVGAFVLLLILGGGAGVYFLMQSRERAEEERVRAEANRREAERLRAEQRPLRKDDWNAPPGARWRTQSAIRPACRQVVGVRPRWRSRSSRPSNPSASPSRPLLT
jgi:hypothetical protein